MKKTIIAFLTLLVIVGGESCQSAKSSTSSRMLKFNFEKGKGYDYEMIMNMDQDMDGKITQTDMTAYYSMDVTDDDGTTKIITNTFERFKMKVNMAGLDIEVDSEKPMSEIEMSEGKENPVKMLNKVMAAIKGKKFAMKVNAEGEIQQVSGLKEMAESIVGSMGFDEKMKERMVQQLTQQFNDQNMKDQFERVLYIFPNKNVKVGDNWQKVTTPGGPMGGKYTSTYTVSEIEGDMVTLEEKSKIEATSSRDVTGNITGSLIVDSKSGLVVTADQDMDLKINAGGKEVRMRGKSKVKGKAR
jgi:Family of unknown function (DUF6263)